MATLPKPKTLKLDERAGGLAVPRTPARPSPETLAERPALTLEDLKDLFVRFDALPVLDDRSADDIIGYDENGLPS